MPRLAPRERRVVAAERTLTERLGRAPRPPEIAQEAGLRLAQVSEARRSVERQLRAEDRRLQRRRSVAVAQRDAEHRVRSGESLWVIARAQLGAGAGNAEVAELVARLWAENAERLRSGDPDLIFPGERLELPR